MTLKINIKFDTNQFGKDFEKVAGSKFKRAVIQTGEYLHGQVFAAVPGTTLRNLLSHDTTFPDTWEAHVRIGFPPDSEAERIASYTEYGTGQRGQETYTKIFKDDKMPLYTIPIVPLKAKYLHWFSKTHGGPWFAKSIKGQKSQAWMRTAVSNALPFIGSIWETEFKA